MVRPGPASEVLSRRRAAAVASGVNSSFEMYAFSGKGAYLADVDGNIVLDLGSGIAVTGVGHHQDAVIKSIAEQASRFTHTCFMVTPYEGYVAVCEELTRLTPGDHDKRSALFTSGAEAVENAIKVARSATGRPGVVVLERAFHGRTNMTMALTATEVPYKRGFGPFSPEVYRIRGSYPFRDGADGAELARRALAALECQVAPEQIACLLFEPIQGEGGFIVPAPGYLSTLAEWCQAHGVVFVADEIQTGFARTGNWFASEHEGLVPDIVITAKGVAAGMPLSGITGRTELINAVPAGGLGGTYGGNPVACAAALASINLMRDLGLVTRASELGRIGLARLESMKERFACVGDIRGRGAMLALEFVDPATGSPDAAITHQVIRRSLQAGVLMLTCGEDHNVIRLLPPLVITDQAWEHGLDVLEESLERSV